MADAEPAQAERKGKIFISYSRKDMAFADRLEAALNARGFEPLIDRTEIYAFEDWWQRIQALISRADSVVFVLSPDAVTSDVALKEVAYAAAQHKRFAPIVSRRVDDAAVPEPLRRLNFVFFDDPESFEANADRLAEALITDIGWIRQHTDFGEAARRWGAAGRPGPRGLLLRSPTLEEAERWIASRPSGAPHPTEETQDFIAMSRRAATQRRNILSASLSVGMLIALVLAGIAYSQRNNAVAQRNLASEQRENALSTKSRLLAGQAVRATGQGDVQTALLLSLEALRSAADGGPEQLSIEADKSLLDAIYRNPLRSVLRAGSNKYTDAVFTFDSSMLVTIAADDSLSFWTIDETGRITGKRDIAVPFGPVTSVFANPARPILVFVSEDNGFFAWNYQTGKMVPGASGTCDNAPQLLFDTAGTRLFVLCAGVSIFAFDTGKVIRVPGAFDRFAISPDGRRFAINVDKKVTVMDGATAAVITTWQQKDKLHSLEMSYDGKTVLTQTTAYDGIEFHDSRTGALSHPALKPSQARTQSFSLSPVANVLATDSDDGQNIWNLDRGAPIQQIDHGEYCCFLPNGFLVTASAEMITLWEYPIEGHTGTRFAVDRGDFYVAGGHSFHAATADGRKVATLSKAGDLYVWSGDPAMLLHAVSDRSGERLGHLGAYSANGKVIVTASVYAATITAWDAATLTEIRHIQLTRPPMQLSLSENGNWLAYTNVDGNFDILDVATLRSIKPAGLPDTVYTTALSFDGRTLALGGDKSVTFWSVADGSNLGKCEAADVVGNIAWAGSAKIAYAADDGTVNLLATDTCESKKLFSFETIPPEMLPAGPGPDGKTLQREKPHQVDGVSYFDRPNIRVKEGLILAAFNGQIQVWSEADAKVIFDATELSDHTFREFTLFDILPGRKIIVGDDGHKDLEVYDLATKEKVQSIKVDTNDCCGPVAMTVLRGGERAMTLWKERRDEFRLRTWRMLPTTAAAIAFAEDVVPDCLSPSSRKNLGLDAPPPRWCIEQKKRPFDTPQWQQWLAGRDAGKPTPMPEERVARSDPGNESARGVAGEFDRLGDAQVARGTLSDALTSYQQGFAEAEAFAKSNPGDADGQRDLSVSHEKIGDVMVAQGNLAEALKAYQASLAIRERLAKTDGGNARWQRDLSASYEKIGNLLGAQGHQPEALKYYRDGLAIAERLAKASLGNPSSQIELAKSLVKVSSASRSADARASLERASAIVEPLAREVMLTTAAQRSLQQEIRDRLAKLQPNGRVSLP